MDGFVSAIYFAHTSTKIPYTAMYYHHFSFENCICAIQIIGQYWGFTVGYFRWWYFLFIWFSLPLALLSV